MTTGVSVRALASPGFALALVVLVLNDHVLKQAYPGWVTGKLSDVAGLVFAPVLLGVLLTAWRVPRPMPVAIGLVGLGFTFAKSTATGAAVASAIWSLTGVPTLIRADVTDLLALPALYGAWLVQRHALTGPRVGLRETVASVAGVALLPLAVLATAATATSGPCSPSGGLDQVALVEGSFTGGMGDHERRVLVADSSGYSWTAIDVDATTSELPRSDVERLAPDVDEAYDDSACDSAGSCWRVRPGSVARVEISQDGGATWEADYAPTADEDEALLADVDPGCDAEPVSTAMGVAVLDASRAAHVVVSTKYAGILMRSSDGEWHRISWAAVDDLRAPPEARRTPHIRLEPRRYPPADLETMSPSPEPCDSPTTVSVTPDPRNGPPTTYVRCNP